MDFEKNRFLVEIFDISCAYCVPMCVYNVPVVCTYFIVRTTSTSNVSAFRERVPIVYTTKTRLCNCIYFLPTFPKSGQLSEKKNASFKINLIFEKIPKLRESRVLIV